MNQTTPLDRLASEVSQVLQRTGRQLVLAESCTAGLVAATLGQIPGISRHLCGSAVVYQEATKTGWLNVSADLLARQGAVSPEVAAAMARGVLAITPHADLAAAITGHLGPDAPEELDGVIEIAIQIRDQPVKQIQQRLAQSGSDAKAAASDLRQYRQTTAAMSVLTAILESLG